jgi:hypothetical protein
MPAHGSTPGAGLIADNQFGVAFEYLTSGLAETDAELTEPCVRRWPAASEMSLEDNPDWRRLSAWRLPVRGRRENARGAAVTAPPRGKRDRPFRVKRSLRSVGSNGLG